MTADTPRYAQIFNTLSRRMQAGKYPVDMRLPTENELCEEFKGFALVDSLARRKDGDMHGAVYERHTLTTIFTTSTPAAPSTS